MTNAFQPAAKLEGWLRGIKVEATCTAPFNVNEFLREHRQ
jgi:hypothetical protein